MSSSTEESVSKSSAESEAQPGARSSSSRHHATFMRIALIIAALAIWQFTVSAGLVDPLLTSDPVHIVTSYAWLAGQAGVRSALLTTGGSIVMAFVIGTVLGGIIGFVLGLSRIMRRALYGPLLFLMSTPKVVFIPIFILVFGITGRAATAFGAYEAMFYVAINVVGGLGLIEAKHLRVARAFKARPAHRLMLIILPAASPGIFSALWMGLRHAFGGVLIMELVVSSGGIGTIVRQLTNNIQTARTMALILFVSVVAVVIGTGWNAFESRLTRWRKAASDAVLPYE